MPERVILLAIDGLDLAVVRRGVAAGRLPHFQHLLERGAFAEVSVGACTPGLSGPEGGMISPVLWTTVATGQYYFQHGVCDFSNVPASPADPPLFESRHVRSPRLWDILSQYGHRSLVVGYYVTHPAYEIDGVMVSDLFGEVAGSAVVWPAELRDPLARVLGAGDYAALTAATGQPDAGAGEGAASAAGMSEALREGARRALRTFCDLDEQAIGAMTAGSGPIDPALYHHLIDPMLRDERFHRVFLHLLDPDAYRFATVYYRLIDFASHGYWPSPSLPAGFERTLDRVYAWMDARVGEVRERLIEGDRLIILSDHGFGPKSSSIDDEDAVKTLGEHAEPATLLVAGGPRTGRFEHVTLLDIAPTIIDFLGIPQAETLDGGPVPGLLDAAAPRISDRVPAYAYVAPQSQSGMTRDEQDKVMERLAALGYVE